MNIKILFKEYPVQSAICVPTPNTKISRDTENIVVEGYAWSGGGRGFFVKFLNFRI